MLDFVVSGLKRGCLIEDEFRAVSERQAFYFFCKKHGFNIRDIKVIGKKINGRLI